VNRLHWVLILAIAGLNMTACASERVSAPTLTFTPADAQLPAVPLVFTTAPGSTPTLTPSPTSTAIPTPTATPIPLPSTAQLDKSFNAEIKPLVTQLLAAKADPAVGLPADYQIVYVPQTSQLYTVQSILQVSRPPVTPAANKLYVLYKYSRGSTLGTRQGYSLNVSAETQEITTNLRLVILEGGKFTLLETENATGGAGTISLTDLVQNAVPPLKILSSSNPSVETDLEEIIGYACGIDMTPSLDYQRKAALWTLALTNADWAGIVQGIDGIKALNPAPVESVPALIPLLAYNSDLVQTAAKSALISMAEDPQVLDLLIKAAANPDPDIRKKLAGVFAFIKTRPQAALQPLITLFYDKDSDVRGYAASALGSFGDPAAIPLMDTALKDKDPDIRSHAAMVLYEFGTQALEAVPNLIVLLQDPDPEVRSEAARALGEVDSQERSALPALIQAARVDDKAFGAEINAITSLSSKAETLPLLKDALSRSDAGVRMMACSILHYYQGVPGTSEILTLALNDPNTHVQNEAITALAALGPEAGPAVPALTKVLQSGVDTSNLVSAMYALGQIGPAAKPAVPALIQYLSSSDEELNGPAETALKTITNQNFGPLAQKWLDWWNLNKYQGLDDRSELPGSVISTIPSGFQKLCAWE
jgi:HEAT repeat protein